ncbi:MAG TPA: extracellular solute-binding protein, partial [Candidatus Limnocylindrales bacterium]
MTIGIRRFGVLAVAATMAIAACSSTATQPPASSTAPSSAAAGSAAAGGSFAPSSCATGSITAAGSTALQPLVAAAGAIYTAACPGSTVTVNGGGSGTGLTQIASGAIDIGDSDVTAESKLATPDAATLVDHLVAKQGWIVVANKDVTG